MSLKAYIKNLTSLNDVARETSGIKNPFTDFFGSFAGQVTVATSAFMALKGLLDWSADKWNLSQNAAMNNTKKSLDNYASTKSELENLNSELETTQSRISELNALKDAGTISIAESGELANLERQNASLERQIALRGKLLAFHTDEAAQNATDTLGRGEQSIAQKEAIRLGEQRKTYQQQVDNVNIPKAIEENVKAIERYESKLAELETTQAGFDANSKEWKNADKEIKNYQKSLDALNADITEKQPELYALLDALSVDGLGLEAKAGRETQFTEAENAINSLLSSAEKQAEALDKVLSNSTFAEDQQKIVDAMRAGKEFTTDDLEGSFANFTEACRDAGIETDVLLENLQALASQGAEGLTTLEASARQSFESTTDAIQSAIDNMAQLQSIMAESNSGKGMSQESVKNFKEMFGDGAHSALERTANGYNINKRALQELQRQQETTTKSDYLSQLATQQEALGKAMVDVAKARHLGQDDSFALNEVSGIQAQIESLKELQYQYETANSAFNKWQNSLSGGEASDMYDAIRSGVDKAEELYKAGKVGANEFKTMVDLMSDQDLSNASVPEITAAYEKAIPIMKKYFTESVDGTARMLKDMRGINEEFAKQNSDGSWTINENNKHDDRTIANALGMDVEAYQSVLQNGITYGLEIDMDQPKRSLEELKSSALSAQEALSAANFNSSGSVNLDNSSFAETTEQIAILQTGMDVVNNSVLDPEVKADRLESMSQIMEFLLAQQENFLNSGELTFDVTTEDLEASLTRVNEILGNTEDGLVKINFEANIDEIDTEIQTATTLLENFKNDSGVVDLSIEGATEATNILENLLLKKEFLSMPEVMNIDVSGLMDIDAELGNAVAKIREFQNALSELSVLEGKNAAGLDVDTSQAQAKVQTLAGEIQGLDSEVLTTLGLDSSEFDAAIAGLQETEIDVKAGVNLDRTQLDEVANGIGAINIEAIIERTGDIPADEEMSLVYDATIIGDVPKDEKKNVAYTASIVNPLKNITGLTATYTVKTIGSLPSGVNGANGSAHAQGTIPRFKGSSYAMGSAYQSGDWGIPRNEVALVNELGNEIRVRDGRWELLQGGAHFEPLKRGDILFNHKQSQELLSKGYVTSNNGRGNLVGGSFAHGTVHGTAYSTGGGFLGLSNSSSYSSTTSKKSNTSSAKAATKTVNNASKATDDALKKLSDYFDFVTIQLSRYARATKIAENAIKNAVGLADTQSKTATALAKAQQEMNVARQAANKYLSHANWYASQAGLSASLQTQVQNGSLNISELSDDDKTRVNTYKGYYEEYLKALDLVDDLAEKEKDLALSRLKNIEDFYDVVIKVNDAIIDVNDAKLNLNDALGSSAVSNDVRKILQDSAKQQESSYNKSLQRLTDYQNEFNSLVNNGYLKTGSNDWYKYQETLKNLETETYSLATALIELEDKIREIDYTKMQQAIDSFQRGIERLENGTSLRESRDEFIGRSDYQSQIDEQSKSVKSNNSLRNKKIQEQGLYNVSSARYQELAKEIASIDGEIYSSLIEIEELRDKVFATEFFDFDKDIEDMNWFMNELDAFRKLMNSDSFVDKKGAFTDSGLANMALLGKNIETAKQQTADYTTALSKLGKMYDSGLISQSEYEAKQRDLLEGIRNSVGATEDYRNELLKLHETQMRAENKALKETISLRKDALRNMKNYYDYADKIKGGTKDINVLKAQKQALKGVNNASAQGELKRIQDQLRTAEEALAKTKRDHATEMQMTGYDKMASDADKFLDATLENVLHNADAQERVISSMLDRVVGQYATAYDKINSMIAQTGLVGSTDFTSTVKDIGTSEGASSIVDGATKQQSSISSGSVVNAIDTSNTSNSNHSAIEKAITQPENTTKRLVVELKLNKTAISLEEGKSDSVTASIRPTDAANKTLSWTSSNTSVATVSNGTVRAIKPGSATITVATSDGSGLSASCGVAVRKKPEPPKPTPKPTTTTGGDGVARVGDRVTYMNGLYHQDSYGQGRRGSKNMGQQVYITKINTKGSKPYHISTGNTLGKGDLGWLTLNQLKGYNTGVRNAPKDLALFDETKSGDLDLGSEVLVTKHGVLKQMDGDTIFSKKQTDNLWKLSNLDSISSPDRLNGKIYQVDKQEHATSVNLHFDSLLEVNGNVDVGFMEEARKHMPRLVSEMGILLTDEINKMR